MKCEPEPKDILFKDEAETAGLTFKPNNLAAKQKSLVNQGEIDPIQAAKALANNAQSGEIPTLRRSY